MNSAARKTQRSAAQLRNDFLLEQDRALKKFVIDEARNRPGGRLTSHAEKFLVDMSSKPSHWRMSSGQRDYMIKIAREQLNFVIPEEFE